MFSSQYVQPNNKNNGDIITIYVEHVRLTDDTINNKTGVNHQKTEWKIKITKKRRKNSIILGQLVDCDDVHAAKTV